MPTEPEHVATGGSRKQKAAAMRAEMEARKRSADPAKKSPDDAQLPPEEEDAGPVGEGDHEVKDGECVASIAMETGHFWETIWNDAANSELKEARKSPYVLLPGDRVAIPEKRPKEESGQTEQRHRFVRKGAPEKLIIHFRINGEPRKNKHYELDIDGNVTEGDTDPNGRVELFIPPNAKTGTIRFIESGDSYELDLGHLSPITETAGVQGRLRNLGFYEGPIDGQTSDELTAAVTTFQNRHGLRADGRITDETRAKLEEVHGS